MWQLPPLKPEEILLYSRKSRTDDASKTVEEILEKHEQMLNEWVERNLPGMGQIPEENRYREVVSGETIESRPKIQEVLRKVESPKHKAVLVVDPQRLSRGDLEDIGRLVKLLRYTNTIVITLPYSYDLRDERDRDQFERELKRGNEFLEYQKKILLNGRLLSVQNGNYLGKTAPYGFKKVQYKDGKTKCNTLAPHPEEAPVIKQIFEWYAAGWGIHRIASELDAMGIRPREGELWSGANLPRMLTNEHYIGMVRWNHRQSVKVVEDGEVLTQRPVNHEYLLFKGKHDPLISQELWDKVQEMRGKLPPVGAKNKYANPLAGILFCQCGTAMIRREYKDKEGNLRSAPRYICNNQKRCHTRSCLESEMLDEIVGVLRATIEDFSIRIDSGVDNSFALQQQLVERLEDRLDKLNKLEISQWEKYTHEGMPKHIFDQLNEKVLKEKDEVQQALCTAKDSMPSPVSYDERLAMFSEALDLMQDPNAPVKEKNLLLKQCIEKIVYTRKLLKSPGSGRWGDSGNIELDVHLRV